MQDHLCFRIYKHLKSESLKKLRSGRDIIFFLPIEWASSLVANNSSPYRRRTRRMTQFIRCYLQL